MGAAASTGANQAIITITPVSEAPPAGEVTLHYFPIWARGPGAGLALEYSGLKYKIETILAPSPWYDPPQTVKQSMPWKTLPVLNVPELGMIGPEIAILNYVGKAVPAMGGIAMKDYVVSQQLLCSGEEICRKLTDFQATLAEPGAEKEVQEKLWTNEDWTTHNKFYGYPMFLKLNEDYYNKLKAGEGKFTSSGTTVGECKLFSSLHALVLIKPDILDKFPGVKKFYDTFMAYPKTKDFMAKHTVPIDPAPIPTFMTWFIKPEGTTAY